MFVFLMIHVQAQGNDVYLVTVKADRKTTHRVTLTSEECRRIGGADAVPEKLIEKSFRFLLEREPNTSILGAFELRVIAQYFPEFEETIRE